MFEGLNRKRATQAVRQGGVTETKGQGTAIEALLAASIPGYAAVSTAAQESAGLINSFLHGQRALLCEALAHPGTPKELRQA